MRISVSIDAADLKQVMKLTGESRKSAAIAAAVKELLRRRAVDRVVTMAREGRMDYGSTNEELERSDVDAGR